MKANEAPDKIYLERILCSNEVYDTWKSQKTILDDIEYTRTDAFIKKACSFIDERFNFDDDACHIEGEVTIKDKVIEDFKNYMKGE